MPAPGRRLGTPRQADEGLRLGTVRRQPRGGVLREHHAIRNYYDLWSLEPAPSSELLSWLNTRSPIRATLAYLRAGLSLGDADPRRGGIALLAAIFITTEFIGGLLLRRRVRCHRALLRELLRDAGAVVLEEE